MALVATGRALISGGANWALRGSALDIDFTHSQAAVNQKPTSLTGLLTTTRASTGYAATSSGLLVPFLSNIPRITDLGLLVEQAATNVVLWNRDLTNAAWTKSNITAALDQTGADGTANAATSLTATAGNGTCLQSITLASSVRFQSAYVKRITGTGTINMTMDNGVTWTAITVTAAYAKLTIPTQTLANPTVGFRIVTSGDAIAVDLVGNETGTFATSPIATTTVAVTRATDVVRYPRNPLGAGNFTMFTSVGGVAVQTGKFPCLVAVNDGSGLNQAQIYSNSGGPTASGKEATGGVTRFDTLILSSVSGGAGKIAMTLNGTAARGASNGGNLTALGTWTTTAAFTQMEIGTSDGSASNALNGYVKRLAIFQAGFSDGQLTALTT